MFICISLCIFGFKKCSAEISNLSSGKSQSGVFVAAIIFDNSLRSSLLRGEPLIRVLNEPIVRGLLNAYAI